MESSNEGSCHYVCINCGQSIKELFKKYGSSVSKIVICEYCNEIADKYIEFEPIIILIDLVLLSRPAYRHVLYNTTFRIHWKLAVVLLLLESYILWKDKTKLISLHQDNFTTEKLFYLCFIIILFDHLVLYLIIMCFSMWKNGSSNKIKVFLLNVTKSITLGSISKFLLLPIIIWNTNTTEMGVSLHLILVSGFYGLSLLQVYSVLTNTSRKFSAIVIVLSFLIKSIISGEIRNVLSDYIE